MTVRYGTIIFSDSEIKCVGATSIPVIPIEKPIDLRDEMMFTGVRVWIAAGQKGKILSYYRYALWLENKFLPFSNDVVIVQCTWMDPEKVKCRTDNIIVSGDQMASATMYAVGANRVIWKSPDLREIQSVALYNIFATKHFDVSYFRKFPPSCISDADYWCMAVGRQNDECHGVILYYDPARPIPSRTCDHFPDAGVVKRMINEFVSRTGKFIAESHFGSTLKK